LGKPRNDNDGRGIFSALDADSEGEEGKFYVWTKAELQQLLGNDFDVFADYFNVNETGFWENEHYILLRKKTDEEIANEHKMTLDQLQKKVSIWKGSC
jgi:uncharacterized protein YyaL (SSP411 family)